MIGIAHEKGNEQTDMTAPTNNAVQPQVTRWVITFLVVGLTLVAMWLVKDILMLTLTAAIIAILLTSPIRFFVRLGIKRPVALMLTLVFAVILIIATVMLVLPGLIQQFRDLVQIYIPSASKEIQEQLKPENLTQRFPFLIGVNLTDLRNVTDQFNSQILSGLANVGAQGFQLFGGLVSSLLSLLVVLFLAIYFVADPETHERGMIKLVPLRYRGRAREILHKLDIVLRNFLQAQLVLMILSGVTTVLALLVLGVPLAGALGTITGLFAFIPNFGPLAALIPILAVAIINTPSQVLLVIIVFYVLQFVQSQLVAPLLMGQEVNLPPSVILLSQIIAGIFFGFLGLLLSVPLAAIVVVLVKEIYVKDVLGDLEPEPDSV